MIVEEVRERVIRLLRENRPEGHWEINRILFGDGVPPGARKAALEALLDAVKNKYELGITDGEVLRSIYSRLLDVLTSNELKHRELKRHFLSLLDPRTVEEIAFDAFGREIDYAKGLLKRLLRVGDLKEHVVHSTLVSSFQGDHLSALYFLEDLIKGGHLNEEELEAVVHRALESLSKPSRNAARFLHLAVNGEYGDRIKGKVLEKLKDHHLEFLVVASYREGGAHSLYMNLLAGLARERPDLRRKIEEMFDRYGIPQGKEVFRYVLDERG